MTPSERAPAALWLAAVARFGARAAVANDVAVAYTSWPATAKAARHTRTSRSRCTASDVDGTT